MEKLYFSILNGRDGHLISNASLLAEEYENYVLISNDSDDLKCWCKTILNETGVSVTPFLLTQNAYLPVVRYFVYHLDFFKGKKLYYADLLTLDITDNINISELLNNSCQGLKINNELNLNVEAIKDIGGMIKNDIVTLRNIFNNILNNKLDFFIGKSNFSPVINLQNLAGSEFSSLALKEIKSKSYNFNSISTSGYDYIDNILKDIKKCIQNLFIAIPTSSTDILNTSVSSRYCQDGYPIVFKLMSIIHFFSSKIHEDIGNYNIAFLHIVRAVECFIDGYLITKGIGSYNTLEEYVVNGRPRKGAGYKFNQAGNYDSLLNEQSYVKIKNLIEMRNKFFLTHGDMRVCENIVTNFSKDLVDLISHIETNNHHVNFKWIVSYKEIENCMNINAASFIYNSLIEKYKIYLP